MNALKSVARTQGVNSLSDYDRVRFILLVDQIATNMSNSHKIEVVIRGSETQLQVGEKLKLAKLAPCGERSCQREDFFAN